MTLRIALLALLCSAVRAGPAKWVDEMHPRSPSTPLEIQFTPYYCTQCQEEEILQGEPETVTLMRQPAEKLAAELGSTKWVAMRTPHFRMFCDLRRTKVKWKDGTFVRADFERLRQIFPKLRPGREGANLDAHERAHLYHIRAERVYAHFAALTDNKEPNLGMKGPYEIYLFDDYAQHHALNDAYIGHANDKTGMHWHVKELPNFILVTVAESLVALNSGKGDKILSGHFIHTLAHGLVDGHGNYFRETWAWLEEGLAHYYERRENPKHNTFCNSEGRRPQDLLKPDWESHVFNVLRRGKDTPLSNWCEKQIPGELADVEHGLSWGIVKWMVETEPIRFTKMLRKLDDWENKPNSAECIEHAFGASPTVIYQRWREYVLENWGR